MKARKKNIDCYNVSFISAVVSVMELAKTGRVISEVIVDVFQDYQDPDFFVMYKIEHLSAKNLYKEIDIVLN